MHKEISEVEMIYTQLESITQVIFEQSGYKTSTNREIDVIAEIDKKVYYIEVKSYTSYGQGNGEVLKRAAERVITKAKKDGAIPVLVVYSVVSNKLKKSILELDEELVILDLPNLIYATYGTRLHDEMISILPFSVEDVQPEASSIKLGWIEHSDIDNTLIVELDNCVNGKEGFLNFEDICFNILQTMFSNDLSLWKKQQKSNKNLYRFDLLCRIKDNTDKTFWSMLEKFFGTKYLIFEFKNYEGKISQREIYTTEKYLYKKALRNVAIIIARNGYDDNAVWAAKGSLRESGKLILLLTVGDLKKMLYLMSEQQDPSELLLNKIDEMLIDLEK